MPDVASQTFDFVGRELNATLSEARSALENYVEQPENLTLLERCKQELHQVQGVLRVLEIYGAALLAEEMEQVTSYLLATAAERKNQAESLDALMRAMVQLPGYLERVLAGGRDLALVLLPLLNDLRAVRGSALLSEGTLLLLNLKSDKQAAPVAAAPGEPPLTVEQWARRLRARFQVGLIGWIRGERIEQNLDILAAVAQKLEQIATRQPLFQLWWVTGAVIEALQENGLEGGVSIKRLLGLADREIKRLYEQGEARFTQAPPVELLNNLLYYVGRAETSGPRVTAVRASFRLSELLPVDEAVEQERENLSAPSVKLMQTVAAAIREDLGKVKDVLDIFVRRGAGQPAELGSQVEMLKKIGDTLGVLGLGELRASVMGETERLEKIVAGTLTADEATLVEIAATLISVEDRLDDRLVGMIMPRTADASGTTSAANADDAEFKLVQGAVLRECILNLARVKEAIAQNVGGVLDAAGLDSWQDLMRGLKAALLMLGKSRAVEIIDEITLQLKRVMQPGGGGLPPGFVDRLADAIVSVEYYMETLQAGRSDPWYMLDNAHTCLQMLANEQAPSVPTVAPLDPSAFARTLQIPSVAPMQGDEGETTDVGIAAPTLAAKPAAAPQLATADPELLALFIEEAREELAKVQKHFPGWEQNPLEQDGLITIRRSFHTLKGSGRMVGARDLSEFAWAIENLLNRLLDNTVTRSPQILAVLRDAVAVLPSLIDQLETHRVPTGDVPGIVSRAHSLASTKPAGHETPKLAAVPEAAAPAPAEKKIPAVAPPPPAPPPAPSASPSISVAAARLASEGANGTGAFGEGAASAATAAAGAGFDSAGASIAGVLGAVGTGAGAQAADGAAAARATSTSGASTGVGASAGDSGASISGGSRNPRDDAPASTHFGSDDLLKDIYSRETAAHVATVRAFVERERGKPTPHLLTEELYRACHTLSGSSKMAEARHGTRLAEPLDHWLRKAYSNGSGVGIVTSDLDLLADCMTAMESVASHLDEATGFFLTHEGLRARIAKAEATLDLRIAESAKHAAEAAAAANAHTSTIAQETVAKALLEEPEPRPDSEAVSAFSSPEPESMQSIDSLLAAELPPDASGEVVEEIEPSIIEDITLESRVISPDPVIESSEPLIDFVLSDETPGVGEITVETPAVEEVVLSAPDEDATAESPFGAADTADRAASVTTESAPTTAALEEAPIEEAASAEAEEELEDDGEPVYHSDYDAEVASIFTEEATELIDVSEQALVAWRAQPDSSDLRSALKRPMHTLKGGARMAGIIPMGDLSHELETLVMQMDSGLVPTTDHAFDVLQTCLDELARMRDAVVASQPVAEARKLIRQIHSLSKPAPAKPAAKKPAAVSSAPAGSPDAAQSVAEPATAAFASASAAAAAPGVSAPATPSAPAAPEATPPSDELTRIAEAPIFPEPEAEPAAAALASLEVPASEFEAPKSELIAETSTFASLVESSAIISAPDFSTHTPFAAEPSAHDAAADAPTSASAFEHTFSPPEAEAPSNAQDSPGADAPWSAEARSFNEPAVTDQPSASLSQGAQAQPDMGIAARTDTPRADTAPRSDESVVPFVERRSSAPIATRAVFPAAKATEANGEEPQIAPPAPVPPGREPTPPATDRPEMARVDAELLDTLLNTAGEVSIARARLEQQMGSIDFNLAELGRTVTRLKEQLRKLEIETEAQILHRHEDEGSSHRSDFDPLELDRYSSIQQFSRALAETANDVQSIQGLLDTLAQDTQNLLQQQARTITELQNGLMRTRMVPFQRHVQRLARIVRQAAADTGKRAELVVEGASGELDRQVLERMLPPFEHMLRNAVVHGIEKPDERVSAGKNDAGRITLELHREGAEVMVRLSDDGAGMNLKAIRDKGSALGLIPEGSTLSDEDAMQLILEPGFSTAGKITQQAGRGVGMDVVATEIKRLGGALHMETRAGQGSSFTIRLPFTLAISHALVVRTGEEFYALPLPTVEGVLRLSKTEVTSHLGRDQPTFDYNGQKYRFQNLATFVGLEPSPLPEQDVTIPVVLVRAGEHSTGLIADELVGSREIVVKSVGPQVSSIRGISGATILGDGRIVVILDIGALVRAEWRGKQQPIQREKTDRRTFVMVVDDSITVRRVTQRLLERNGMRVITARDGLDAVTLLQDHVPDIILLDIEMPRMDGYEVAGHVRNDPRLADVPIIMITSRVGEKHRARAIELGVNDYLGKPYQEAQLLDAIAPLVEQHRSTRGSRTLAEAGG
jgi:chemosensory pili system protein ChpA (sensor histidine kinase/response regulator)